MLNGSYLVFKASVCSLVHHLVLHVGLLNKHELFQIDIPIIPLSMPRILGFLGRIAKD